MRIVSGRSPASPPRIWSRRGSTGRRRRRSRPGVLMRGILAGHTLRGREVCENALELFRCYGLEQMCNDSGRAGPGSIRGLSPARHGNDGGAPKLRHRANARRGLHAIDARQADVHENEQRPEGLRLLDRFLAGAGSQNRVALEAKQILERCGRIAVVIDDHDPCALAAGRFAGSTPAGRGIELLGRGHLCSCQGQTYREGTPQAEPGTRGADVPPCICTIVRTRASPIPSPPPARGCCSFTWENISKTCSSACGGMPMPLSVTATTASSPSCRIVMRMRPPASVYLALLWIRLVTTWVKRSASPSTMRPSSRTSVVSVWPLASSAVRVLSTARPRTSASDTL